MSSTILAIRAVTSLFAKDLLRPVFFIGIVAYAVVMAIVVWITTSVNGWWILLGFIPTVLFFVGLAVWIGLWIAASKLSPGMNSAQKRAAKNVVGKLSRVAEQLGTPRIFLIVRIAKDILFPKSTKTTLIGELTETPGELRRSIDELRKLF